ncbi:hypothetical protein P5641_19275 [Bacillus subtilis]|nr:hypothetical protein P5641_19275 [Bacillus subtilis]
MSNVLAFGGGEQEQRKPMPITNVSRRYAMWWRFTFCCSRILTVTIRAVTAPSTTGSALAS